MPITLFTETSPPDQVTNQVCQIAAAYLTDLGMLAVPASNCLHEFYQWALGVEVCAYSQWIGQPHMPPVEMLVAFDQDNPAVVTGFLLYLPMPTHPEACGITYMAVQKSHRGRGIGTAMMKQAVARYPHAELSCPVGKVEFYERLGFRVLRARNTQVVMNTRASSSEGMIAVVNVADIYESPQGRQIQEQQLQRWGRREWVNATKKLQRQTEQLERQAEAFVKGRLGQ